MSELYHHIIDQYTYFGQHIKDIKKHMTDEFIYYVKQIKIGSHSVLFHYLLDDMEEIQNDFPGEQENFDQVNEFELIDETDFLNIRQGLENDVPFQAKFRL